MKKRIFYIISFLVIFCIEVLIALYVRDNFVRPYIGDVLVVVLVYSFVRIFLPTGIPRMPFYVFLFACFIEVMQYFQLVETLGITNRAAKIILGSTFDWKDIPLLPGKEGWLKAGVVGGYIMLIIMDLRIHLPPPPTGTPPS